MSLPLEPNPESEPENPWTTLGSRPIYENPWIAVREDQVLRPDGLPGIYGVVHFKNHAVGVLPVDEQGNVWLVGQHRYPLGLYSWEIPEGGGPAGEPPEETARRELREETGLFAEHLETLGRSHLSNSVSDELAFLFRATGLTPGPSDPEGTERLQVCRFAWPDAWSMLQSGQITDSMTVIALLHEAVRRASTTPQESIEPAGPDLGHAGSPFDFREPEILVASQDLKSKISNLQF